MKELFNNIMFALRLQPLDITLSLYRVFSPRYKRRLEKIRKTQRIFKLMQVSLNASVFALDRFQKSMSGLTGLMFNLSKPMNEIYVRGLRVQWNEYRAVVDSPLWR